MRRYIFLFILGFSLFLYSEPYKPYPILFVHGLGAGSGSWGPEPDKDRTDWVYKDSIQEGSTYEHFLDYMNPYAIAWDEIDSTYTTPGDTFSYPGRSGYPNKSFLEVVNMDEGVV